MARETPRLTVEPRARARRCVLLLVALALGIFFYARRGVPPFWTFAVHRDVTAEMARRNVPGLSLAVALGDKVRWSAGFGLADVENHVPARAETVYRLASVSRPITAVAVLQQAERGTLRLDAPIQTYVPSFPEKPWPVTLKQLLAHLGGVRQDRNTERRNTLRFERVADALAFFRDDPLECEPGTKPVESSHGYTLLGCALEAATGRNYRDVMSAQVFGPSRMTHTGVADLDPIIPRRAHGYLRGPAGSLQNARPADPTAEIPGEGLCGTAVDLARFAIALQSGKLVTKTMARTMFTRQTTNDGTAIDYGLGWRLTRNKGRAEVWHSGKTPQVSTILYMIPDRRFAVAILCNLEGVDLIDLARKIADDVSP